VFKIAIDAPKQENPANLSGQDNSVLIVCTWKMNRARPYFRQTEQLVHCGMAEMNERIPFF
jgi:hypothetical protein